MTQKELNYIEDIYNHESLIINILKRYIEECDNETYISLLESELDIHTSINKKIMKLLEANK